MPTLDIDGLIVSDLEALSTIKPATVYYVDEAPMDDTLPTKDGLVVPHIIVHPGVPSTSRIGRGIINTSLDPVINRLTLEVVAPNYTIAKNLGGLINDRMMGRKFGEKSSELVLDLSSGGKSVKESRVPPVVYKYVLSYRYITNL